MFLNTLKWTGAAVLVGGLAFTGIGVMARQDAEAKKVHAPPPPTTAEDDAEPKIRAAIEVPDGVAASPNSDTQDAPGKLAELRRELLKAANSEWVLARENYLAKNTGLERAYQASKRLMDAHQDTVDNAAEKSSAVKAHQKRIRSLARAQNHNSSSSDISSAQINAYVAEAALWLAEAETPPLQQKGKESSTGPGNKRGRATDLKSQLVLAKLDETISMSFAEDTPLEDVLKYIKQVTTTKTYTGIPIYVDPVGLQEAKKSMTSTVRNMDLEGVPLRRTLQLLLKQIDLMYFVEDGILYITGSESEDPWGRFGPAIAEPSPILQKAEKAKRGELSLSETKELLELLKTREQIIKLEAGEAGHEQDVAQSNKEKEEARQDRESMKQLLKEMRELMQVLKAERQTKIAADGK